MRFCRLATTQVVNFSLAVLVVSLVAPNLSVEAGITPTTFALAVASCSDLGVYTKADLP